MTGRAPRLQLHTAPFLHTALSTPRLMLEVAAAAGLVWLAACWFFGLAAVLVVLAAILGAVGTEWLLGRGRPGTLGDGSALLTGLLLGLTLPPAVPLWMAVLGGIAAIALGKAAWGGLGQNLFNPALVGRAFLQAAFPTALTTWTMPRGDAAFFALPASTLAWPLMHGAPDGVSGATPLSAMKFAQQPTALSDLLLGTTSGSLGETSALLLLLCGLWLGLRRAYDWRVPVAVLLSVALAAAALHLVAPGRYPSPAFTLLSGGLLFGTVFMATDPVTSPTSPLGAWVFGAGIGLLVVLIRLWGGLPEGVMYAILLMNGAAPLLERGLQPRPFGRERRA